VNIPGLPALDIELFSFLGKSVSLLDLLIFFIIVWIIGILPSPFRQIAGVILALWLLSFFGVIAIAGLSNILIIVLIVGLLLHILRVI
jgi:hypothetical protein